MDVRNAFNTVRRDKMLKSTQDRCPEIYRLAYQAYSDTKPLHIPGAYIIPPSSGVQQRDPIGPICFSLAIDDCARSMQSPLNLRYLDDATISGPVSLVAEDLVSLQSLLPDLGLELNTSKCEFTVLGNSPDSTRASITERLETALPGIRETALTHLTLLGSPLTDSSIHTAIESAVDIVSKLCDRIRGLDTHTAILFLAHYISAPRLQYLLRSSPIFTNKLGLQAIDTTVKSAVIVLVTCN